MADFKQIQVRIWQDNWFLSLNPEEKLLWLYLLTNEYSHISGLYELPKPLICPITGIKNWQEILNKFEKDGKIKLYDSWIFIVNKIKHQPIGGSAKDRVNISINKHFQQNKEILNKMNKKKCPFNAPLMVQPQIEIESEIEIENKIQIERVDTPSKIANKFFNETSEQERIVNQLENKGYDRAIVYREIVKFISYWTELNKTGTKKRWELEKTFELGKRLANWFSRINDFNQRNKITTLNI